MSQGAMEEQSATRRTGEPHGYLNAGLSYPWNQIWLSERVKTKNTIHFTLTFDISKKKISTDKKIKQIVINKIKLRRQDNDFIQYY